MASGDRTRRTYATILVGDAYAPGVIALATSIERSDSRIALSVLHDSASTANLQKILSLANTRLISMANLPKRLIDPPLCINQDKYIKGLSKMHCWQLTEYDKVVFLDPDTCVLRNCDHMFEFPELSACAGNPLFNSGVMVLRPSLQTFDSLMTEVRDRVDFWNHPQSYFNGSAHDQMPLARFFKDRYRRIGPEYNATVGNLNAVAREGIFIRHWNGRTKPWMDDGADSAWREFWPTKLGSP